MRRSSSCSAGWGSARISDALAGRRARGVGFVLLIFLVVLLHEYGHALAARALRDPDARHHPAPSGGVARLERMPKEPRQELVVALAGPAVNVVLALVLWIGLRALGTPDPIAPADDRFLSRTLPSGC
jgi:Zn-dependent protease